MTHPSSNSFNLVADIGGTNTRVACADGKTVSQKSIRRFPNKDYTGLEPILNAYIAELGLTSFDGACIDLAGPVRDNVGRMTNLDWVVDHELLKRATGATHVDILNDLQAQGHSVGTIDANAMRSIIKGPSETPSPTATSLVINVGTGFNAAPVFETSGGRFVAASECGHVTLNVQNEDDLELYSFLKHAHGFASSEDVLSGRGLENIYQYLGHKAGDLTAMPAADIMAGVTERNDPRASETLQIFCRVLGSVAGDLALTHLPFGGIFLVGGVARAVAPHLLDCGFEHAFKAKGRFTDFMNSFSVSSIEDDYAALNGCASHLASLHSS